jgi:hypothetical protein
MTDNTTNQTEKIKTYRKLTRIHEQYNKPVLVQERKKKLTYNSYYIVFIKIRHVIFSVY